MCFSPRQDSRTLIALAVFVLRAAAAPADGAAQHDARMEHDDVDESVLAKAADLKIVGAGKGTPHLNLKVLVNHIRQNPQYTLAGLSEGVYVIGMKDQFNIHDLHDHPIREHVQYVADEVGFILFDRAEETSVDSFGPYFIEQYILMEVLSKQEVAQNVLDYYLHQKEKLQRGLANYRGTQGKGFICWRFVMNENSKAAPPKLESTSK